MTLNLPGFFSNRTTLRTSRKIALLCGAALLYVGTFYLLYLLHGAGMSFSAVILVLAAAWLFGRLAGVVAALVSFGGNYLLCAACGIDWAQTLNFHGAAFFGTIGMVALGLLVGRLRNLLFVIGDDIQERIRLEERMQRRQGQLEDLHAQLAQRNADLQEEIRQRDAAMAALTEARQTFDHIIDNSLTPILIGNDNVHIRRANRACIALLGCSAEGLAGQPLFTFLVKREGSYESTAGEQVVIDEAFLDRESEHVVNLYEHNQISDWNTYVVNAERQLIPVSQNIVFRIDAAGKVRASFAIIRDITEQRRAELSLIRSKEEAEAANRSKSAFLANMSHEIRTPMNGVIGFTDMLLESGLTDEQSDYAQTIKRSGEALLSIINDILDFSKIEAGKISMDAAEFDLEVLAYDVCEMIRPRLASHDVELLCSIDEQLPMRVQGDPHRYRQVLVNLMGNAAKFTESGEIELQLAVAEQDAGRVQVEARVRDTGIGIAADKLEAIFDVFQQADSSTTRKYGGTGLGLSICRKIAHLMDGHVWAESTPGAGSVFHFTAWLQTIEAQPPARRRPAALSGRRVLIVDDNQTNRDILNRLLQAAGMVVTVCDGGATCLDAFRAAEEAPGSQFDIVILDIRMPAMDGYSVARQIRQFTRRPVALLAFTSSTVDGASKCQASGFDGFLPKPAGRQRLLSMVERLLSDAAESRAHAEIVTQHSVREDAKRNVSILLAEDNPVNQKLALRMLGKAGYQVAVAENGRLALEMLCANPDAYDMILMDIQMPEMNGLDATRAIRSRGFTRIPIIAMTANAMKGDRERCLAGGMDDYIAKPVRREDVFALLEQWVFTPRT